MILLNLFLLGVLSSANGWTDTKKRRFSEDFLFGAATSAYQVEGAWNEDGKSESIWDRFLHSHPELVPDGSNGDIAADTYHNVYRDVEMLRELGVDFYRFSISWPRVMPTGFPNKINEKALQYYDTLITELLKHKIEPMITLYHFDLPQSLQDLGGWANAYSITWFEDYAKIIFNRYADRVKYWVTINQPNSFPNKINEKALQYYDTLIKELLKHKIEPMITLYHFDLPQSLQDLGGWANAYSITWFEDYAKIIFNRYADRVKYWVTINQPNSVCNEGYGDGIIAPGVGSQGIGEYMCIRNVLLAHAKAYRLYEKEFKKKYKGSVGLAVAVTWIDPLDVKSEKDKKAAEVARAFTIGIFMDPIWSKYGDFPAIVKETIAKKSKEQGFPTSRLPAFTPEEIKLLKGSADFVGMNHYTTFLATFTEVESTPSFANDMAVAFSQGPAWKQAKSSWLKSAPYGLYKAIIHINKEYDYPAIMITEHGWSTTPGLWDRERGAAIRSYLAAALLAVEDGARLLAYTAWSLMDNVEWIAGTSERFGLYEVDFASDNKTRTARLSALIYKRIIETRAVDDDWDPTDLNIRITPKKTFKTEL